MGWGPLREEDSSSRLAELRAELEQLQQKLLTADDQKDGAKNTLLLYIARRIREISCALAEQESKS